MAQPGGLTLDFALLRMIIIGLLQASKQAVDEALRSISFIDEETLHQSTVLRHVHLVSLQHTVVSYARATAVKLK